MNQRFCANGPLEPNCYRVTRASQSIVLAALKASFANPTFVLIEAPRRRGKSSLLRALQEEIVAERHGHTAIYIPLKDFREQGGEAVWRMLAHTLGMSSPAMDFAALVRALLDNNEVLLMDDLEAGLRFGPTFWEDLRYLIESDVPVLGATNDIQGEVVRQALGTACLQISLPVLTPHEARLLLSPLQNIASRSHWPENWAERLHRGSGGEPWQLQLFAEIAVTRQPPLIWNIVLDAWQDQVASEAPAIFRGEDLMYCHCGQAVVVEKGIDGQWHFYDPDNTREEISHCPGCGALASAWTTAGNTLRALSPLPHWLAKSRC